MKVLRIISSIFYPTTIAVPLVIALLPSFSFVLEWFIGILFLSIVPTAFIIYKRIHHEVDLDVSIRSKRLPFLLVALIGQLLAIITFFILRNQLMLTLSIAYFTVTLVITIITGKWKISIHAAGVGGAVHDVVYVYWASFPLIFTLFLLVPLVIYVRIKLKAHTFSQATSGAIISIILSYLVFRTFYPL